MAAVRRMEAVLMSGGGSLGVLHRVSIKQAVVVEKEDVFTRELIGGGGCYFSRPHTHIHTYTRVSLESHGNPTPDF